MTTTADPVYTLDGFARSSLLEHSDGWRAAIAWLATSPARLEVINVARIWRDLHDGGYTGCDTVTYDAKTFPGLISFLEDTPSEIHVFNGVKEMADINRRQGTNYAPWPKKAFNVSFDSGFLLGFAAACDTAMRMR
ncbi:hypothetical protein ACIBH1_05570 [Nonomuraea sp. NPDC050663]|uniref:hypothetical protein n=1 Tax=Nonomuraea sp. NPDC050663 TaxID=3364370 RepID=UPI00378E9C4B